MPSWWVSCYLVTKVRSHFMPCCCVLCFQGKARSERAETKVSTFCLEIWVWGGGGGAMRAWDLIFFCVFLHKQPWSPLSSFLRKHLLVNLFLKFKPTHSNTHETLHNGITSPHKLPREISTQFSGDKYQLCLFRWMSGYTFPPSSVWSPRSCSVLVSISVPLSSAPVTG